MIEQILVLARARLLVQPMLDRGTFAGSIASFSVALAAGAGAAAAAAAVPGYYQHHHSSLLEQYSDLVEDALLSSSHHAQPILAFQSPPSCRRLSSINDVTLSLHLPSSVLI